MTQHGMHDPHRQPHWGAGAQSSQPQYTGQPPTSQPQYMSQPPPWQGQSAPVSGQPGGYPVTGPPVSGYPVGGYPTAPPPQPRRSRKLLWTMMTVCVVLAVVFAGSAYYLFFSGAEPEDVVTDYVESVLAGDLAGAREFACADATDGVRFNMPAEGIETVRRWFDDKAMTWSIRESRTSGSKSTVIGDVRLMLPQYDGPVDMRWDFGLTRESGTWMLCTIDMMSIVDANVVRPETCVRFEGFDPVPIECYESDALMVTLEVANRSDCPDSTSDWLESTTGRILCLDESPQT